MDCYAIQYLLKRICLQHLFGYLRLELFINCIVRRLFISIGHRHDDTHDQRDTTSGPERNNPQGISGNVPACRNNTAHQHGPERGTFIHLFPPGAHDQNQTRDSPNLERTVHLIQDGSGIKAKVGRAKAKGDNGYFRKLKLLLWRCILFQNAFVEITRKRCSNGKQECRRGREN